MPGDGQTAFATERVPRGGAQQSPETGTAAVGQPTEYHVTHFVKQQETHGQQQPRRFDVDENGATAIPAPSFGHAAKY